MVNKIAGIYAFINLETGYAYIGQSNNLLKRCRDHIRHLNEDRHINKSFQNAWNKNKGGRFKFTILETVTPEEIIDNKYLEDLELTYITSTQLLYNKKDVDCSFSKRHRPQLRNELKSNKFSIVLTKTALLLSGKQCSEQGNISRSELFERYLRNKIFQSEIQPEIKEEQNLVLVNEKINNEIDLFSIYKHIQRLSKSEIKENLQLLNTIMRICLELLTSLWINENDNV